MKVVLLACLVAAVNAATPARPVLKAPTEAVPAPLTRSALASSPTSLLAAKAPEVVSSGPNVDITLLIYIGLWYLGNYYYTISNKLALNAAGGKNGFPLTISTMQLGVGVVYALYAWLAPDMRKAPEVTLDDVIKMIPVGFCAAAAHSFSVFAQSAGAVSFAMIVKAAEPAFAALIGTLLYGKVISRTKWLCLIPVIGGVCLASVKELDFAWSALITAAAANLFAAFKANENKKLMDTPGIKDRLATVGNQFALTTILAFFISLPFMYGKEGAKWGEFVELFKSNSAVRNNLISSGMYFYLYNELATNTIKKTSATTQSVANTAKRVIVIVGAALAFGESLEFMKMLGCAIGIGGVFLYSLVK